MALINGSNVVNDTLIGTGGDDTFNGLSGIDTAQIASASSGAIFSRDSQGRWVVTSAQGIDTLDSIEQADLNGEIITLGRHEWRVNSTTANIQSSSAVASLAGGGWVVTWNSFNQDGDGYGVYQQRFTANGLPEGGETRVTSTTADWQYNPAITALPDGGWVVTWQSDNQDNPGGFDSGIFQQRYSASGATVGGEVQVNTLAVANQITPSIQALDGGGWLVSWNSWGADGDGYSIVQQRFDDLGAAVGVETLVNSIVVNDQYAPSVTALVGGGWVVTWMSLLSDGSGFGIYQQRYTSGGVATGGQVLVNSVVAGDQMWPSVTALPDGGWLVSWMSLGQDGSDWGVYQKRFDNAGLGGGDVQVNTTVLNAQNLPSVTTLADGGWVITWQSWLQDGSGYGIYQQRYNHLGIQNGGETRVNTYTNSWQTDPSVTALSDGGWLVSWSSYRQDGSDFGVYQQRYDAAGNAVGSGPVLTGDAAANTLVFSGSEAIDMGGAGGADTLQGGSGNDTLDGGTGIDTAQFTAPSSGAVFSRDSLGRWVVTSSQGTDALVSIEQVDLSGEVVTIGRNELRVNTTTASDQLYPSVTALADGGWLVSWTSANQDGSGYGIYQQRYHADGSTTGYSETRVNTTTASDQSDPSVTALADGGWLVSWTSWNQDGSGWGIYQQRYLADGSTTGYSETRVNTTTASDQLYPSVTALADGGWLVSWTSANQDGSGYGIYQQRYHADGSTTGFSETRVNTTTADYQYYPSVTALADGGWLVSWTSANQDGSGWGIYQQRYLADGSTTGYSETRVNTTTASDQLYPSVTALADGGWLVSWTSANQDGSSYGIYQQRYNADGSTTGFNETRVNTTTADSQEQPSVTALTDGGWLVSWTSWNQDGSGWGIYQQRYHADGSTTGFSETRVNTTTADYQYYPSVTALADGGWLVSWMSGNQDGSSYGIYQQRYLADGSTTGFNETRVNTTTADYQGYPSVTALADGGWLVSWQSANQDGRSYGIYQQRYDATGAPAGTGSVLQGDALDNTLVFDDTEAVELWGHAGADTLQGGSGDDTLDGGTGSDTARVAVAQAALTWSLAADGRLLLASGATGNDELRSVEQALTTDGAIALAYNTNTESRVNTTTASDQQFPSVTALADGGWLVSWMSYNQDVPGSFNWGIYQQRYHADGSTTGFSETRVNTTTASDQLYPSVTALADGGWLVSWTSANQDGSGYGIYQQRYNADGLRDGHLTLTGDASDSVLRLASAAVGVELLGGIGADTLAGGALTDRLSGGTGADTFEFGASGNGRDHITDFTLGDRITIAGAAFAGGITDGDGSTVGQNAIEVSHTATQTVLHIGTDAVPGADVVILLDGVIPTGNFLATGTDITLIGAPTMTFMAAPVDTTLEDTEVQITFADIAAQADEADPNGTVMAFVVQDVSTGTLRIGTSAGSATPFVAGVNDTIDATHQAYWMPAANANGALAAFTLLAKDNDGYLSTGPVQAAVNVTPVNDAPVLTVTDQFNFSFSVGPLAVPGAGTSGNASPYPSTMSFAGFPGILTDVNVRLTGVTHLYPDDLDILLTGPGAQSVVLMSEAGGSTAIVGVNLVIDDQAVSLLPDSDAIVGGTYQPTNFDNGLADVFPAPAPGGPYGSALSVFNGFSLNTVWSLYVVDDTDSDVGSIASWGLDVTTREVRNYTENAPPLSDLGDISVSDADDTHLESATVQISGGFQTGDVLGFVDTPNITGVWNASTRTLTLTGADTPLNYQIALGTVTFANTTDNPGSATRTLSWRVNDGSADSAVATSTVTVTPVNDAPVLSTALLDQNAAVFETFSFQIPAGAFTDADGDTLTYSTGVLPGWLSFNPATRTFSGTPGVGDTGSVNITVTATDPSMASTFDVFGLTVAPATARVYIAGTDMGGGVRTLSANTAFLGAAATAYQWYRDGVPAGNTASINVAATDNFALYTVVVNPSTTNVASGPADPQAVTPPAGILQTSGNPGNDTLPAAPTRAQVFLGYHGLDTITGTNGADWIDGGPGVDSMLGGLGNDTYIAHDALDVIVEAAGGGTDLVFAYVTTTLAAEVENLTLAGSNPFNGTGNGLANVITGNGAANTIGGLGGNDTINAGAGNDSVDGGADNDRLDGGDGADTLLGGAGNDSLIGGAGSDSLDGGQNNDTLDGGAAADVLLGGDGNDSLIGNAGNDTLTGGTGTDTLTGGAGLDTFVLDNTSIDLIQNFVTVDDTFRLTKTGMFTALNLGPLNGAAFWSGTAAHEADDRIIYNPTTGALWYDADGNGAGAAIQIATLTGLVGALSQSDFVVVV